MKMARNPAVSASQTASVRLLKPDPFTVRKTLCVPIENVGGLTDVMVGTGYPIMNGNEPDVPPPGAGFTTVTFTVSMLARSLAETSNARDEELV
jgi:hypothetical protein